MGHDALAPYRVLFALLARQDLLGLPLRSFAEAADVAEAEVSSALRRLEADGTLGRTPSGRVLLRPEDLLDRWVRDYAAIVRPKLCLGRYRGPEPDPVALDQRIEGALGDEPGWALGAAAAAFRLTGRYRGETTVLHLAAPLPGLAARLGVRPDAGGPLFVLLAPGPLAFDGPRPHLAHPLLVYTELQIPS